MPYTYDPIFAADPNNPAMVAKDAAITIFDPAVPGVPVTITDPTGAPLPNPITVNAAGFGPAFQHATLDRVGWSGGGFSNFLTSYEGMKEVATDAQTAAAAAAVEAANAGAGAAAAASAGVAGVVTSANSAATAAANSAAAAQAAAALVGAPADAAIEAAIKGASTKTREALNTTIAAVVDGAVVDAVANSPEVAAEAAALAQSDAGLVRNTDPAIPQDADLSVNVDDAIALEVDAQGFVSRAILPDGTQYFPRLRVDSLTGAATAKIKGRNILCRGDSITAGAMGDGVSYPVELSRLTPGVPVFKRGWPGEKTGAIAQRQGSVPLMVTVTGGVLAASTAAQAVAVDSTIFIGADSTQGVPEGLGLPGSINGVSGRLSGNPTSGFFFTRNAAGGAINVPAAVPWVDDWETSHRDCNQILWTGRNNVNIGFDDVVPITQKMIDHQVEGDHLVLAVLTRSDETSGTAGYNRVTGWNSTFASTYGDRYFDIRRYLIDNGLAAAGLTPTTADNTAIAGDTIPPQLLADGLHPTAACYKVIAAAVKTKITEMGWV